MTSARTPQKLAFVSDAIYPYNKAGKEKRIYDMSIRLHKFGYEVHIYGMKYWDGPRDRVENGVHLHGICKARPLYSGERRSIRQGVFFGLACLKLVTKKFDVVDVDHMPFFPLYAMWLVCKLRHKRLYATWHEVWGRAYWVKYMGVSGNFAALMERVSVLLPDKIITVSELTHERLVNVLHCKKDVVVVPCGIDYKRIQNIKPKELDNDVVYFGRLLKHKRVDLLVRAMAKMKARGQKPSCIIIGEGPEKSGLIKLAKKLHVDDAISFHPYYTEQDDVFAIVKASKVFAFPSEREGFGMVAPEANACGRPVVTNLAEDNAAKHLVSDGHNGFRFEQTATALADQLERALGKWRDLEQDCVRFAKQFDCDDLSGQLAKAYDS